MNNKFIVAFAFVLIVSIGFVFAAEGGQNVINLGSGQGDASQIQEGVQIQDGEHMGENGEMFRVQTQANNQFRIEAGEVSAECDCEMTQAKVQEKTQLFVKMSNGTQKQIKVMPDVAAERALERLRLNVCSEENNCSIELKEVGKRENSKELAYEMQIERHSRILGLFQKKMQVKTQVNAENGEIIRVKKPWWAFLATEPAEE